MDSKSKVRKEKKTSSSDQASLPSARDTNVSLVSAASAGISEARVSELIADQLGQFSSSFAPPCRPDLITLGPSLTIGLVVRLVSQNLILLLQTLRLYRLTWVLAKPRQTPPCVSPV